jgi:hypothetical protein
LARRLYRKKRLNRESRFYLEGFRPDILGFMQRLLDQAAVLIRDAREVSPEQAVDALKEAVALLEAARPSRERDGMMALAYLRLAQLQRQLDKRNEAERFFMLGYSYARSSRQERVRRLAEKLNREFVSQRQG